MGFGIKKLIEELIFVYQYVEVKDIHETHTLSELSLFLGMISICNTYYK